MYPSFKSLRRFKSAFFAPLRDGEAVEKGAAALDVTSSVAIKDCFAKLLCMATTEDAAATVMEVKKAFDTQTAALAALLSCVKDRGQVVSSLCQTTVDIAKVGAKREKVAAAALTEARRKQRDTDAAVSEAKGSIEAMRANLVSGFDRIGARLDSVTR